MTGVWPPSGHDLIRMRTRIIACYIACSRASSGASKGQQSIDDRGLAPLRSSMASPYLYWLHSRGRLFAKGHLWARGTASFARALSPKRDNS